MEWKIAFWSVLLVGCVSALNLRLDYVDQLHVDQTFLDKNHSEDQFVTQNQSEILYSALAYRASKVSAHTITTYKHVAINDTDFSQTMYDVNTLRTAHGVVSTKARVCWKVCSAVSPSAAMQYPVLSFFSTTPDLVVRTPFPFFASIAPMVNFALMTRVLQKFGWSHMYMISVGSSSEATTYQYRAWLATSQPDNQDMADIGDLDGEPGRNMIWVGSYAVDLSLNPTEIKTKLQDVAYAGARLFYLTADAPELLGPVLKGAREVGLWKNTAWFVNEKVSQGTVLSNPYLFHGLLGLFSVNGIRDLDAADTIAQIKQYLPADQAYSDADLLKYAVGVVRAVDTVDAFAAALDLMLASNTTFSSENIYSSLTQVKLNSSLGGEVAFDQTPEYRQSSAGTWRGSRVSDFALFNLQLSGTRILYVRVSTSINVQASFSLNTSAIIWPNETVAGRRPPPDMGVVRIGAMWSYAGAHCAISYAIKRMNEDVCSNPQSLVCQYNIRFEVDFSSIRVTSPGFEAGLAPTWVKEYVNDVFQQTHTEPVVLNKLIGFIGSGWSSLATYTALLQNLDQLGFPSPTIDVAASKTSFINMHTSRFFLTNNPNNADIMYAMATALKALGLKRVGVFVREDSLPQAWKERFMAAMVTAGYKYSDFSSVLTVRTKTTGAWDYVRLSTDATTFAKLAVPMLVSVIMGEFLNAEQVTEHAKVFKSAQLLGVRNTIYFGTFGQKVAFGEMLAQAGSAPSIWSVYQGGLFLDQLDTKPGFLDSVIAECDGNPALNFSQWDPGSLSYYVYGFNAAWTYYDAVKQMMEEWGPLTPTLAETGEYMNSRIRATSFVSNISGFATSYPQIPRDFNASTGDLKKTNQIAYAKPATFAISNLCSMTGCQRTTSSRRSNSVTSLGTFNDIGQVAVGGSFANANLNNLQWGVKLTSTPAEVTAMATVSEATCPNGTYYLHTLGGGGTCTPCDKDTYREHFETAKECHVCPTNAITKFDNSILATDCLCNAGTYFFEGNGSTFGPSVFSCPECKQNWNCPSLLNQNYQDFHYLPEEGQWANCTDPEGCGVYACTFKELCAGETLVNSAGGSSCFTDPYDPNCQCRKNSKGVICGVALDGWLNRGNTVIPFECGGTAGYFVLYFVITLVYIVFLSWAALREEFVDGSSPRGALVWILAGNLQTLVVMLAAYSAAMPDWSKGVQSVMGTAFRLAGGLAVFSGLSDVTECHDPVLDHHTDDNLVLNVVILSMSILVPLAIWRGYIKIVLGGKHWFLKKAARCRRRPAPSPAEIRQTEVCEKRRIEKLKEVMTAVANCTLFLLTPAGIERVLRFLNCATFDGVMLLEINLEEKCFDGHHLLLTGVLAIPAIVIFGLVVPMLQNYHLFRNKADLSKRDSSLSISRSCGILFLPFENHYYWWASIVLVRKVLFSICVVVLEPLGQRVQSVTAFVVLNTALVFHVRHRPYLHDDADVLEFWSLAFTQGTLFMFIIATDLGSVGQELAFCSMMISVIAFFWMFVHFWIRNSAQCENNENRHGDVGRKKERHRFDHKEGMVYRSDEVIPEVTVFKQPCSFCDVVFYSQESLDAHNDICRVKLDLYPPTLPAMGDNDMSESVLDL